MDDYNTILETFPKNKLIEIQDFLIDKLLGLHCTIDYSSGGPSFFQFSISFTYKAQEYFLILIPISKEKVELRICHYPSMDEVLCQPIELKPTYTRVLESCITVLNKRKRRCHEDATLTVGCKGTSTT
jgi:hypothetical protein